MEADKEPSSYISKNVIAVLLYWKIFFILIVISVVLFFGFIPFLCKAFRNSLRVIGFANSFSGGLFIGIGLFHLLPEASEIFEKYFSTTTGQASIFYNKPLAYFIAFFSYSLILFVEKVAFDSHALTEHTHFNHRHDKSPKDLDDPELKDDKKTPLIEKEINGEENERLLPKKEDLSTFFGNKIDQGPMKSTHFEDAEAELGLQKRNKSELINVAQNEIDSDADENTLKNVVSSKGKFVSYLQARNIMQSNEHPSRMDQGLLAASKIIERTMDPHGKDEQLCCIDNNNKVELKIKDENEVDLSNHSFHPTSVITPYVLLIALSLHGLFEGTALGIMSNLKKAFFLFVAILAHKWAEAFALGISFFKSGTETKTYVKLMLLFSLFTPLGIIVGMYFQNSNYYIQGVLLSASAGTFVYISATEVVVEEFAITKYRYQKFLFYLLGSILVGLLAYFE